MKKTTIIIANRQKLLREILSLLLNKHGKVQVVASCSSWDETLNAYNANTPDCIIIDVEIIRIQKSDTVSLFTRHFPKSRVIVISECNQPALKETLIQTGVYGYLTKCTPVAEVFTCIAEVGRGNKYVCSETKDDSVIDDDVNFPDP